MSEGNNGLAWGYLREHFGSLTGASWELGDPEMFGYQAMSGDADSLPSHLPPIFNISSSGLRDWLQLISICLINCMMCFHFVTFFSAPSATYEHGVPFFFPCKVGLYRVQHH